MVEFRHLMFKISIFGLASPFFLVIVFHEFLDPRVLIRISLRFLQLRLADLLLLLVDSYLFRASAFRELEMANGLKVDLAISQT